MKFWSLLSMFVLLNFPAHAQCLTEVNSNGFEYSVDVDIAVSDVIYTQAGTTCNINLEVTYDINITIISSPPWWDGQLYTLQGTFNCLGASGTSFFNLPNGGGTGTTTSATFSFNNTDCSDVIFECPLTLQIQGPELNTSMDCGTFAEGVLPVVLSEFSAEKIAHGANFYWKTATELNLSHFELQVSDDMSTWITAADIAGQDKMGSEYNHLCETDLSNFYARLKLIDLNGSVSFSDALFIKELSDQGAVSIYPTPSRDFIRIRNLHEPHLAKIYNLDGRLLLQKEDVINQIDISELQSGNYILKLEAGGKESIYKRLFIL